MNYNNLFFTLLLGYLFCLMTLMETKAENTLSINTPSSISGGYSAGRAFFGPQLDSTGITGDLELAVPSLGAPPPLNNLTGKIAVIDRGIYGFVTKVKNAQDAGAIGVIVINNQPGGGIINMGGTDPTITIPSIMISYEDGQLIKTALVSGSVNATFYYNRLPVAICRNLIVFADANSQANITAEQVSNGSFDPDGDNITLSLSPVGPYSLGETEVTLTVNDGQDSSSCLATIIITEPVTLSINTPSSISGSYLTGGSSFGPQLDAARITGDLKLAVPSLGAPPPLNDLTGKIPVIDRGTYGFATKVKNAQDAGAIGAIVINNVPGGGILNMGGTDPTITIPSIMISYEDGQLIKTALVSGSVNVTFYYNLPPIAICQNVKVSANANCLANLTAEQVSNGSFDPDGDNITLSLSPVGPYSLGETEVTLTVNDGQKSSSCIATITVTSPLILSINPSSSISGNYLAGGASFGPQLDATGITGDLKLAVPSLGAPPPLNNLTGKIAVIDRGTYGFAAKVKNAQDAGAIGAIVINNLPGGGIINMGGADPTITIPSIFISKEDGDLIKIALASSNVNATLYPNSYDIPPVLVANLDPIKLWPANHKYETIEISHLLISVSEVCGTLSISDVYISSVISDEVEDAKGDGDGNTLDDIIISRDCKSVQLRKERKGNGNGRVYTITLGVQDSNGKIGTTTCQVIVPHSKNGVAVNDNGAGYTVNGSCGVLPKTNSEENTLTQNSQKPESYSVWQNYPNPFNPSTVIKYAIPTASNVKLEVFNITGEKVATLVDGFKSEGYYEVNFNANGFASGMYLYRISAGAFVQTRKMILLR